jgi:hypothetical protein
MVRIADPKIKVKITKGASTLSWRFYAKGIIKVI